MPTATKIVPKFRFKLNQSWNGSNRGDVIEVGPGLLDALQRGNRGELVGEVKPKMARASAVLNKSLSAE